MKRREFIQKTTAAGTFASSLATPALVWAGNESEGNIGDDFDPFQSLNVKLITGANVTIRSLYLVASTGKVQAEARVRG